MDTWPFPCIPPEAFEALTDNERHILEALTRTYLAHVAQRQQQPAGPGD